MTNTRQSLNKAAQELIDRYAYKDAKGNALTMGNVSDLFYADIGRLYADFKKFMETNPAQ